MSFRDIQDVHTMLDAAHQGQKAVVIGGGLLGLEAANGLLKQGMQVIVVHLLDSLMNQQLDKAAIRKAWVNFPNGSPNGGRYRDTFQGW